MDTLELPLREIHFPSPISLWWPLAIGWWLLGFALIFGCIISWIVIKRWRRFKRLQRVALDSLNRIEIKLKQGEKTAADCLADISVFIRQIMLKKHPNHPLNQSLDEEWVNFLDSHLKTPLFGLKFEKILTKGPYQKEVDKNEVLDLLKTCRQWIKQL